MSFLDTEPAPIRLDRSGPWTRFKVADAHLREAALRKACRTDVPLTLGAAHGRIVPATLWSVDQGAGRLHLSVTGDPSGLEAWAATPGLWAAGYVRGVKLQFELRGLRVAPRSGSTQRMLHAEMPLQMVQLPRRRNVRVRRSPERSPSVRLLHPMEPTLQMQLSVVDISLCGCALWQRLGGLPLLPGAVVSIAELQLEEGIVLRTGLQVRHLSGGGASHPGGRLGCEWQGLDAEGQEILARWIAHGRRRRDLLSLSLE